VRRLYNPILPLFGDLLDFVSIYRVIKADKVALKKKSLAYPARHAIPV
jgi:hypothetical protein